jgi:hypothetical protein
MAARRQVKGGGALPTLPPTQMAGLALVPVVLAIRPA